MRAKSRWLALLLVLGLVLAACGDDAGTTTTTAAPATTTTAAAGETTTTAAGEEPMDIATDVGVDLDAGVIRVGMLSDLTGPFGPLVSGIVEGHRVFWENINRTGGVHGLEVELVVRDTQYVVDNHVQLYEELKDDVVAFGHSTGSPHTVAIAPDLARDGILAVPLTWYSGWYDPQYNANLVHHGAPYCIEAMNLLGYITDQFEADNGRLPTLAIATVPGDYGLDGAAGARISADTLGLEIVYDGSGAVIPTEDLAPIAEAIVRSDADVVWLTVTPGAFSAIYGTAFATGFEAIWTGSAPNWNPGFIGPDSDIRPGLERDYITSLYLEPWGGDSEGIAEVRDLMAELSPGAPAFDYYGEGFVEATILYNALLRAYENGDMTQAGVLAAAKSLEEVDFKGMAPNETYVGTPDEQLQRAVWLWRPDGSDLLAGGTGAVVIEPNYTHPIAAEYVFTEACYQLGQ